MDQWLFAFGLEHGARWWLDRGRKLGIESGGGGWDGLLLWFGIGGGFGRFGKHWHGDGLQLLSSSKARDQDSRTRRGSIYSK